MAFFAGAVQSTSASAQDSATAIDMLLEPGATMLTNAEADNAQLLTEPTRRDFRVASTQATVSSRIELRLYGRDGDHRHAQAAEAAGQGWKPFDDGPAPLTEWLIGKPG